MRSGSPTFGTPEQIKATLGSGQLARHVGLPWRSSSGSGSNIADAQGAHETEMSAWAAVLGGANAIMHSAGWLEGGLTLGYEKMITDMEMVQSFAEVCAGAHADEAELAFDAIADVTPGGHFFATQHTMDRYRTAFYEPLVADSSNFGQWQEAGSLTADQRATSVWKSRLEAFIAPKIDPAKLEELDDFIARRISEGGAPPMG
jgi:trimethylamine--corrinoid protein Co-methyltransferase